MEKPIHPKTLAGQVLMFLAHQDVRWSTWGPSFYMTSVQQVLPVGTSSELQHRYMRLLQSLGLVGGCDCGCRGDYTPTQKGLEFLVDECVLGASELERWVKERHMLGY